MDSQDQLNRLEQPVTFTCGGAQLVGVLHGTGQPADVVCIIVVGGPQYRVGSHRQFVHLARALAAGDIPTFRFDYRGLGDSEGELAGFEAIEPDIRAAVDIACEQSGANRVVLWGLCDAATAILFYANTDSRVSGVVLANPWVRTEHVQAQAYVKHYYARRILEKGFWQKLAKGRLDILGSSVEYLRNINKAFFPSERTVSASSLNESLAERVGQGLLDSRKPILVLLSDRDLTAAEFSSVTKMKPWRRKLYHKSTRYFTINIEDADHTFSRAGNEVDVEGATMDWIRRFIL